jgi:hypothetical protein
VRGHQKALATLDGMKNRLDVVTSLHR